jgi:ubiquitin C-terminal hydrolase
MIISLKRFNHVLAKNMCRVTVPHELDMSKYSLKNPTSYTKYRLVSISHHSGGFSSGHYTAICRHPDNVWSVVDDETVRVADVAEVNHALNYGYVYFYEECKS